jgi:hypothetical protein
MSIGGLGVAMRIGRIEYPSINLVVLILVMTVLIGAGAWCRGTRCQMCFSARWRGRP